MKFDAYFESKYANGALCNEPYSVNEETKQMLKEAFSAGESKGYDEGYDEAEIDLKRKYAIKD